MHSSAYLSLTHTRGRNIYLNRKMIPKTFKYQLIMTAQNNASELGRFRTVETLLQIICI